MSVRAVSFSDINYWIGEGNVEAMLVIAWNDGKTPEALAWGYKGEEETTINRGNVERCGENGSSFVFSDAPTRWLHGR